MQKQEKNAMLSMEELCADVWEQMQEQLQEQYHSNVIEKPWFACFRSVLDQVFTVPTEVQKFMLYNMMVESNVEMDNPHTNFFRDRFPHMVFQIGKLLKVSLLDNSTMATTMITVPCANTRRMFPKRYFVYNPSLELIWYDPKARKICKYLVTIGSEVPKLSSIGPMQVCLDEPSVTEDFISCTPITRKPGTLADIPEDVTYYQYKEIHYKLCRGAPTVDKVSKREIAEMKRLSVCDMATRIVERRKTEVCVKEMS